jgi:hypothetical protein
MVPRQSVLIKPDEYSDFASAAHGGADSSIHNTNGSSNGNVGYEDAIDLDAEEEFETKPLSGLKVPPDVLLKASQLVTRLRRRLGENCADLGIGRQPRTAKSTVAEEYKKSSEANRFRIEGLLKSIERQVQIGHVVAPKEHLKLKAECQEFHRQWAQSSWKRLHSDAYEIELPKYVEKLGASLQTLKCQQRGTAVTAERPQSPSFGPPSLSNQDSRIGAPRKRRQAQERPVGPSGSSKAENSGVTRSRENLMRSFGDIRPDLSSFDSSVSHYTGVFGQAGSGTHGTHNLNPSSPHPGIVFCLFIPSVAESRKRPKKLQWLPTMQRHQFLAKICKLFQSVTVISVTVRIARPRGRVEERTVGRDAASAAAWRWVRSSLIILQAQPSVETIKIDTQLNVSGVGFGWE